MTPDVLVPARGGELLRHLPLLFRQLRRQDYFDRQIQVAKAAGRAGHPLAGEPDDAPVLCLGRDAKRDTPLQRGDGDLATEQGLVQRDRRLGAEVVPVAREEGVRLHADAQVEIARRAAARTGKAWPGEPDALPVADAPGDLAARPSRAAAVLARDLDGALGPLVRLGERDLDLGLHVLARSRARSRARPRPAEQIVGVGESAVADVAEQCPEEVREPGRVGAEGIRAGRPVVHAMEPPPATRLTAHARGVALPVRTHGVVALALGGIAEDLVGLVDLLEPALRLRLLVDVRVVLARELAVRLLDVLGGGVLSHPEDLVVVLVLDRHGGPPASAPAAGWAASGVPAPAAAGVRSAPGATAP